ncbi:MAG: hypothetical protein HZA49_08590 [Planctomycetes bacterium]|nr:hypothetical protein [Planctomycetota bacterium]
MLSKGYLISAGIIVFWLIMTGLFIRREILPALPALSQPSYEAYLKSLGENKTVKMGIYFGGARIGSSQTDIQPIENNQTKITNSTDINLPGMMSALFDTKRRNKKKEAGKPGNIPEANVSKMTFSGYSLIDEKYKLKSFSFSAKGPFLNYNISGEVKGGLLGFTLYDGLKSSTSYLPYKDDSTVSDGLSPFVSMPHLTVGKEWSINCINPFGASMQTLKARVESRTQIEWQNRMVDVYEVVISDLGMAKSPLNYTAYITPDGQILKQEILLPGLYLMRE